MVSKFVAPESPLCMILWHLKTVPEIFGFKKEFTLKPATRGFHLITQEVVLHLPQLPDKGLLHLFVKHTSCGLCLNENADPDVRYD